MCRQINGCANLVAERLQGTKGSTNCENLILDLTGKEEKDVHFEDMGNL
jgi:hypothetical protein